MAPLLAATVLAAAAAPVGDAEGAAVIEKVWASSLRTCGASAFYEVDGRAVIELDHPVYRVAATKLTDAAKESGYEFQATAIAAAGRWRWAPRTGAGVGRWSDWREGANIDVRLDNFGIGRDHALIADGVLHFDVARKNGRWTAYRPLSPLNTAPRPAALEGAALSAPPCARLVARR